MKANSLMQMLPEKPRSALRNNAFTNIFPSVPEGLLN
jgi:hypothetical protein